MERPHWSKRVKGAIDGSVDLITRYPGVLGFTSGTATAVFTGSATMAAAASVASPAAAAAAGGVTAVLTGYGIAGPVMAKAAERQKNRRLEKDGPREIPVGMQGNPADSAYTRTLEKAFQARVEASHSIHARAEASNARVHELWGSATDHQSLNRAFSAVLESDKDSPKGPSQSCCC